jgi:hypothetical protein
VRVTFVPPEGRNWKPATQLFPTDDPWTFTAPNFQYFMDSPIELADQVFREFTVRNPDGKTFTIRIAMHFVGEASALDAYVAGTKAIVEEQGAVFGEYPEFDTGTYTFLGDYLPWGGGDGMEHRNSTVVAAPLALRTPGRRQPRARHGVARVLPRLERRADPAAEPRAVQLRGSEHVGRAVARRGVHELLRPLTMHRAGLVPFERAIAGLAG